ncbi:MAG: cytochrome family, partial [Solirubrobacteraceae bacterium]|nr:cytochrome family [Solirubrobacteraceae bacterium]
MDAALPPGPRAPRAAQMAAWLARPGWFAGECRARFGDTFTLRVEERPWVVVSDPAAVRQVFTAPDDVMHGGEANMILRPTLGAHSVMLLDEAAHLHQRRLMLPAFHGDRLARYREIMVEATERAMTGWRVGEPISLRPHAQAITLEVIVRAVFGVADGRPLERVRALLAELLDRLTRPRRLFLAASLGPHHPLMLALARRELVPVDAELHRLIRDRRAARDLAERDDVLSMLMLARDEHGGGLSDAELRDELMTLLVAGHETTANSLAW